MLNFKDHPIFQNIPEAELDTLFHCLTPKQRRFCKNDFILRAGEPVQNMGLVLEGTVLILKEDYWGNRSILSQVPAGGLFAEAFSAAGEIILPVSVMAAKETEILFLDVKKVFQSCAEPCCHHVQLIHNMIQIMARKNLALTQKMEHITKKTTRDKLLSYLSLEAEKQGKNPFCVPFSRQELADYLSVDRSAMCHQLSKMQKDGLVRYQKSLFELL